MGGLADPVLTVDGELEFRVLGPIEVRRDGRPVRLGGRKQRMLLAMLLLRANEVVSVDQLVDALWGDPAPARAAKSLHVHVSELRKVLGHAVVQTRAPGYTLVVPPERVDLTAFEAIVAGVGDVEPAEAATRLREALRLFRGAPLAEFAYEPFAAGEIARIEELRLQALEERIDADLRLGRHATIVGELESLVTEHPVRERLRAHQMLALYRCGRQAEALAAYQEARRLLVDELGLQPGRDLQALQTAILRQDRALDVPRAEEPDLPAPVVRRDRPEPVERREERRTVTVLAATLGGITGSQLADPEDARHALRPFQTAARREVESHGGVVERLAGASVVAVFGGRVAHEDDPERAVRAALAIRDWVLREGDGPQIWLGIETGTAIVSSDAPPEDALAAVSAADAAQRLQDAAPLNGILVGRRTYRATRDLFDYGEATPIAARGLPEPIPCWEVSAASPSAARARSRAPFVGRQHELDLLVATLARVRDERSSQLVTLVGVPGIGKTRLLSELSERMRRRRPPVGWLQGRCLPYGDGVSLWALGEVVKAQAGILESDTPERTEAKLATAVGMLLDDRSEQEWVATRLGPLVGARRSDTAETAERAEAFAAWRRFLEALADQGPLVLAFEDLHWADDSLLDFVDELTERSRDAPLLILCTTRPELFTRRPGWGGGKANSLTISLPPLSTEDTAAVVAAVSHGGLAAEVRTELLERAAGNPLYAEQFARAVTETGALDTLPETVQGIIAARLDALSREEKELLQDAAVVGKVFWLGALDAVGGGSPRAAQELLDGLERREFVHAPRRSSIAGEAEYAFRHALLRDVAYEQIPRAERVAKHRLAARWIEAIAEGRVTDHAEILAYHYARALGLVRAERRVAEASELEALTGRFLELAGDRAFGLDAATAERHYRDALELHTPGSPARARVLTRAAEAAWQTGRFATAEERYGEAISEFRSLGNRPGEGEAMVSLALVHAWQGRTVSALTLLTEAVTLLEHEPAGRELAQAYAQLARERTLGGHYREGLRWAEKSLELADRLGFATVSVLARQYHGFARVHLGEADGLLDLRQALHDSVDLGLGQERVRAHVNLGYCLWFHAGPTVALDEYGAAMAHAEHRGLDGVLVRAKCETPWLLFDLGRWDELLQVADEVLKWDRSRGTYVGVTPHTYRACVLLYRGALEEAAEAAEQFAARARDVQEPQLLAPAVIVAARVEQARGRRARAVSLVEEFAAVTRDDPVTRLNHVMEAARVCAAADELALARDLVHAVGVVPARQRNGLVTAQAIVREAEGRHDEASALYERSAAAWNEFGHVLEHAQALLGVGRCSVAAGHDDAHAALAAARAIFDRLGARPLAREADELLARPTAYRGPRSAERRADAAPGPP